MSRRTKSDLAQELGQELATDPALGALHFEVALRPENVSRIGGLLLKLAQEAEEGTASRQGTLFGS